MKTMQTLTTLLAALIMGSSAHAQTNTQPPTSGVKPSDDTRKVEHNSNKERPTNPNNSNYQPSSNAQENKTLPSVTPTEPKKVPTEIDPAARAKKSTDTPTPTMKPSPSANTPETKGPTSTKPEAGTLKRVHEGKEINKPIDAIPGDKPQN